jgi:hypothetical protein
LGLARTPMKPPKLAEWQIKQRSLAFESGWRHAVRGCAPSSEGAADCTHNNTDSDFLAVRTTMQSGELTTSECLAGLTESGLRMTPPGGHNARTGSASPVSRVSELLKCRERDGSLPLRLTSWLPACVLRVTVRVLYVDAFEMLRRLSTQFSWRLRNTRTTGFAQRQIQLNRAHWCTTRVSERVLPCNDERSGDPPV